MEDIKKAGDVGKTTSMNPSLFIISKALSKFKNTLKEHEADTETSVLLFWIMEIVGRDYLIIPTMNTILYYTFYQFIRNSVTKSTLSYTLNFPFFDKRASKDEANLVKQKEIFMKNAKCLLGGFISVLLLQYSYDVYLFNQANKKQNSYHPYLKNLVALLMSLVMVLALYLSADNNIIRCDFFGWGAWLYFYVGIFKMIYAKLDKKNPQTKNHEEMSKILVELFTKIKDFFTDFHPKSETNNITKMKKHLESLKDKLDGISNEMDKYWQFFYREELEEFPIHDIPFLGTFIITKENIHFLALLFSLYQLFPDFKKKLDTNSPKIKEQNQKTPPTPATVTY